MSRLLKSSLFCKRNTGIPENWFQNSTERVLREDGCEINLVRDTDQKACWIAMVPAMQERLAWCSLADDRGIIKFSTALDAIEAVESYLQTYEKKFPESGGNGRKIDLSVGSLRVSGGSFGSNP